MREVTSLDPSEIQIGDRARRELNRDAVTRLKESITKIGLRTPISVKLVSEEEGWFLVAGRHRLQACIELGWQEIPVREEIGSDLDARMWEIAENLHRADLTVLERDEHIAEWIRLEEERDKSVQLAPVSESRVVGGRGNKGGISAAARELGIESTQAKRAVKVAGLPESAKEAARETGLDNNQSALLAAAKAPDPEAAIRNKAAEKADTEAKEQSARPVVSEAALIQLQRRAARETAADTMQQLVHLLRLDTTKTLHEIIRTLGTAKADIAMVPKEKRIAAARGCLRALGLTDADLRPVV